jgi:hypothetical protein
LFDGKYLKLNFINNFSITFINFFNPDYLIIFYFKFYLTNFKNFSSTFYCGVYVDGDIIRNILAPNYQNEKYDLFLNSRSHYAKDVVEVSY